MTEPDESVVRGHDAIGRARRIGRGKSWLLALAFVALAIVPGVLYSDSLDSLRSQLATQSAERTHEIAMLTQDVGILSRTLARDELAVCKAFHVKCPAPVK